MNGIQMFLYNLNQMHLWSTYCIGWFAILYLVFYWGFQASRYAWFWEQTKSLRPGINLRWLIHWLVCVVTSPIGLWKFIVNTSLRNDTLYNRRNHRCIEAIAALEVPKHVSMFDLIIDRLVTELTVNDFAGFLTNYFQRREYKNAVIQTGNCTLAQAESHLKFGEYLRQKMLEFADSPSRLGLAVESLLEGWFELYGFKVLPKDEVAKLEASAASAPQTGGFFDLQLKEEPAAKPEEPEWLTMFAEEPAVKRSPRFEWPSLEPEPATITPASTGPTAQPEPVAPATVDLTQQQIEELKGQVAELIAFVRRSTAVKSAKKTTQDQRKSNENKPAQRKVRRPAQNRRR